MDELFGILLEMLASLFDPRRPRPGATAANAVPPTIGDRLRGLSQQLAPPQPAPPPVAKPASPPAARLGTAPLPAATGAALAGPAPPPTGGPRPASAEGGAVATLFANPQSLVAAFIVSEALAKPVALRDR